MIEIIPCDIILHITVGWKINPLSPVVSSAVLGSKVSTGEFSPVELPATVVGKDGKVVSLDVRGEKVFIMQRMKLSVFVDVQNVTNRKNPEEIIYSQDYKQKSYIIGLPILPVAGARLDF